MTKDEVKQAARLLMQQDAIEARMQSLDKNPDALSAGSVLDWLQRTGLAPETDIRQATNIVRSAANKCMEDARRANSRRLISLGVDQGGR